MSSFTARHAVVLIMLTLCWGVNWPVMKIGVMDYPPLTFRAISIWLGVPVLGAALLVMRVPFGVPRAQWRELWALAVSNMFVWHIFAILGVKALSSGRAAILGYTMPIFSALWGLWFFSQRLAPRNWLGVGAAALGVVLLLWHEIAHIGGRPLGALAMLLASAVWAYGTQRLRHTTVTVPVLTIAFWMTVLTAIVMTIAAAMFEAPQWTAPPLLTWLSVLYNAVLIFGFAHAAWFFLARTLPPIASTLSVMMIPVLGVFSGAIWLNEQLHWQDWSAVALMVVAIATVLWPGRAARAAKAKGELETAQ